MIENETWNANSLFWFPECKQCETAISHDGCASLIVEIAWKDMTCG